MVSVRLWSIRWLAETCSVNAGYQWLWRETVEHHAWGCCLSWLHGLRYKPLQDVAIHLYHALSHIFIMLCQANVIALFLRMRALISTCWSLSGARQIRFLTNSLSCFLPRHSAPSNDSSMATVTRSLLIMFCSVSTLLWNTPCWFRDVAILH